MVKFNPIPAEGTTALINRLRDEYSAHYFYTNVSNACNRIGYTAAAKYYSNEAAAELEHAKKIQDFLNRYNIPYMLPAVPQMGISDTLTGMVNEALEIEVVLADNYNEDANNFETCKPIYNLLLEMVEIQSQSVAESLTIVDQINMAEPSMLFLFQNEIFGQ